MGKNPTSRNEGRLFYAAVHYWLKRNFGVADRCENKNCKGKSVNYDWAKKKGEDYDFKRSNFIKLCHSCHKKYDLTDTFRKKMSEVSKNRAKTHCIRGHEFTEGNTYLVDKGGINLGRHCRICKRLHLLKSREAKRMRRDLKEKINKG